MDSAAPARTRARELLAVAGAHAAPDARGWLEAALKRIAPGGEDGGEQGEEPFARGVFFGFYAGAGRRLRSAADAALSESERARLRAAGIADPGLWSLADLARAALLIGACSATAEDQHVSIATEAFRKGDNAERVALLRSLPLLPSPARFTALAVEACRTHVLDVFAAIACENPFPAQHFPELNFNQLVMKALFLELALKRVVGWRGRNNPELVRMASDYEAERRAAGRPVPPDIALIKTEKVPP
jgi:hypothetical protein